MKLIIQIPCYNEEEALPITVGNLPEKLKGIDTIEILIVDDGSTDRTVEAARKAGVHHIVKMTNHKGLAEVFLHGLDASLRLGADIIVNTDADNQYCSDDIQKLVDPILSGEADMVIGTRNMRDIEHFSFIKKKLQSLGSWVVRQLSGTRIPDTTSGFRAFNREAALRLNVVSKFTYTLETVIQAGKKNIALAHVPVRTNKQLRKSRLFSSIAVYLKRSIATMSRVYTLYEPLKVFLWIGGLFFGTGFLISLRYLYFHFQKSGGHIQSLILAAVLMIVGFQVGMIGLLSDIISANRRLIEETLYRIKKIELSSFEDSKSQSRNGKKS